MATGKYLNSTQYRNKRKNLEAGNCVDCGLPRRHYKMHCDRCNVLYRIRARNRYRRKVGLPQDMSESLYKSRTHTKVEK